MILFQTTIWKLGSSDMVITIRSIVANNWSRSDRITVVIQEKNFIYCINSDGRYTRVVRGPGTSPS